VVAVRFEIEFHTPFRVSSGQAGEGSDAAVDRAALLPGSSLKGVMRSAARDLLRFPGPLVEAVFGAPGRESPWGWSDAALAGDPVIRPRTRIQIGDGTGTVIPGALLVADEVLAVKAEFSVERTGWIAPAERPAQETVVLAAARAVTAVGANRRRGIGWVTVTPVEPAWRDAHVRAAAALAGTGDGS
jgi:CRISPR/Cas system CSM-associated protein Csm3 (group 7 of RAMP superfamily)